MYIFLSLGETPIKVADNHWLTIFTGIQPPKREKDLTAFDPKNSSSYVLFIANRNPLEGTYINVNGDSETSPLEKVISFLHTAKEDPESISRFHNLHSKEKLNKRLLDLDEIVNSGLIKLKGNASDFVFLPSIEPFILPKYIRSEFEFRKKEAATRIKAYLALRRGLGLEVDNTLEFGKWTKRNAALARLAYIVKDFDHVDFKPLIYCSKGNHYWDWLKGKDGNLFVRSAYIVGKACEDAHILLKEKHPSEYGSIPAAICPIHNDPLQINSDNYYEGRIPVSNKMGIHARPANIIVESAKEYEGEITISNKRKVVNAKNNFEVLTLNAKKGAKLKILFEDIQRPDLLQLAYHKIYRAANYELN